MITFRSTQTHIARRLYSLIADIVSFLLFLLAGFVGLLDGKSFEEAVAWRDKLEEKKDHGTERIMAAWKLRKLPIPIQDDRFEAELLKAKGRVNWLKRLKKIVIAILMTLGAFFWFFARYLGS